MFIKSLCAVCSGMHKINISRELYAEIVQRGGGYTESESFLLTSMHKTTHAEI